MSPSVTCRHCGKVVRSGQVVGVAVWREGQVYLHVHFRCPRCRRFGHANLSPILWAGATLTWETPPSEMTEQEAERFQRLPPITTDEVLEFYEALKSLNHLPRSLLDTNHRKRRQSIADGEQHNLSGLR